MKKSFASVVGVTIAMAQSSQGFDIPYTGGWITAKDLGVFDAVTGVNSGLHPEYDKARSAFLAHPDMIGGAQFDSFESISVPPDSFVSFQQTLSIPNIGTVKLGEDGKTFGRVQRFASTGRGPVSGDQLVISRNVQPATGGELFRFLLEKPAYGFGIAAEDVGDLNGNLKIDLMNGPSIVASLALNNATGVDETGNLHFVGYVQENNPFDQIVFRNIGDSDIFGFDDMILRHAPASTVPDTGVPVALTGVLLGGLALVRRKVS